jgi:hypothetical protein
MGIQQRLNRKTMAQTRYWIGSAAKHTRRKPWPTINSRIRRRVLRQDVKAAKREIRAVIRSIRGIGKPEQKATVILGPKSGGS